MVVGWMKDSDVKSFRYEGNDSMIMPKKKGVIYIEVGKKGGNSIPVPHPGFKASLVLKDGSVVKAPSEWRKRIWVW